MNINQHEIIFFVNYNGITWILKDQTTGYLKTKTIVYTLYKLLPL